MASVAATNDVTTAATAALTASVPCLQPLPPHTATRNCASRQLECRAVTPATITELTSQTVWAVYMLYHRIGVWLHQAYANIHSTQWLCNQIALHHLTHIAMPVVVKSTIFKRRYNTLGPTEAVSNQTIIWIQKQRPSLETISGSVVVKRVTTSHPHR